MRDNEALLKEHKNHLLNVLKWMRVASRSSQDAEDRLASEEVGWKQIIFFSNMYSDWVFNLPNTTGLSFAHLSFYLQIHKLVQT